MGKDAKAFDRVPLRSRRNWSKHVDGIGHDGCWLWTGATNNRGYGVCRVGEVTQLAHRVAYVMYNGPIPEKLTVDHVCSNQLCVNPAHLHLETNGDNLRLAAQRRREQQ